MLVPPPALRRPALRRPALRRPALRRVLAGLVLVLAPALGGCATTRPYIAPALREAAGTTAASPEAAYTVLLVGDVGASDDPEAAQPVLAALAARARAAGPNSAVVFLGDQLPDGLPDSSAAGRAEAEARLRRIAAALDGYDGAVYVVAGDRDWASGGAEAVRRQARFLEAALGRDSLFLPGGALPGPAVVELPGGGPVLVALDTPWWFQDVADRPTGDVDAGGLGEIEIEAAGDVVTALSAVLAEYDDANVLVVGHHPLQSGGPRAGRYPLSTFALPPVVGAAVPLYRTFVGGPQDLVSPRYRDFREAIAGVLDHTETAVIYAAAHEHALAAYAVRGAEADRYELVSGTAADADAVSGRDALYAHGTRGFLALHYGEDGRVALEAVTVNPETGTAQTALRAPLRDPLPTEVDPEIPTGLDSTALPSVLGQRVTVAADSQYLAGPAREFFFGEGYREAWAAPVEVPVLDLGRDYGGLTPVQIGGGQQTVNLRLQGGDGHLYGLRLTQKRSAENVPEELQDTAIQEIVQDLTSATNPYAPLPAAALADAAGLYHTEPRFVWVPDDPRLGVYRERVANQLAVIEVRPADDLSDLPTFGGTEDAGSTAGMIRNLREDNDHRVDGPTFLRARLLDLLMSDWDRHTGNWRWAEFEPFELDSTLEGDARTQGKVYRPIPIDRDFAFYRIGGLVPGLFKYFDPQLQNFEEDFGDLRGLAYAGVPLDRRFLSALPREAWEAEVRALQTALTPEVVEAAFRRWPEGVYAEYGPAAVSDFLTRLEKLPGVAERFYAMLARTPDVVGSDQHERFEVTRLPDGRTEVAVFKTNRDGEASYELFRRTLLPDETGEVRLYAFAGRDRLVVDGDGPAEITVRFIGGQDEDRVEDRARSGNVFYYDTEEGNETDEAGRVALRLSDAVGVNLYDPYEYDRYPVTTPTVALAYNGTDGLIVGGGAVLNRPGFRREPWAATHAFQARVATATLGLDARYAGRFYDRFGRSGDLALEGYATSPRTALNFYGLSNESGRDDARDEGFYQVRIASASGEAALVRRLRDRVALRLGPSVRFADVERDSTRFAPFAPGLDADAFEPQVHGGTAAALELTALDRALNPREGLRWTTRGEALAPLNGAADAYGSVASDLAVYLSPSWSPQVTLAARVGGGYNVGDFPFFAAQTLGEATNLRGYRRERFAGRASLYQSAEVRAKLFDLSTALLPLEVGGLAFFDNGRVWADGERSSAWHQGYGGGLWLGFLDRLALTTTVGASPEGALVNVRLGFLY